MDADFNTALDDITAHLTSERQVWLFGAGISCCSGLPLMGTLTELVALRLEDSKDNTYSLFCQIRNQLPETSHIEHVLSQIGDLIALAERSRDGVTRIDNKDINSESLKELHGNIRDAIQAIIRYGYHARNGDEEIRIACESDKVVSVDLHQKFIKTLFAVREKPGRSQRPIQFFTLNYDTLLEDALAMERVAFVDGFSGGGMAFWSPQISYSEWGVSHRINAHVYKLHGSVDWHSDFQQGFVYRCRDGRSYPKRAGNVLIYPQSTKYLATQKDPFAKLFEHFRSALTDNFGNVLAICGYSFGDEHVDLEIESAMARSDSRTVIVAFVQEIETDEGFQLPSRLIKWLSEKPWRGRVFAITSRGLYHGSLNNLCEIPRTFDWWTFEGVTKFLSDGPQQIKPIPDSNDETSNVVGTEETQ
ncbi:SIR2 family protein [Methylosarcina fibrata]|uniref:SIR2 family protein n=1 Tax=Methylosarcina fibrata TaxID=105972 RepID=UPI000360E60B|nr:SIR2 family protein [Methylosarcina fibrata]